MIILEKKSWRSMKGHKSSNGFDVIEPSGRCMEARLGARGSLEADLFIRERAGENDRLV